MALPRVKDRSERVLMMKSKIERLEEQKKSLLSELKKIVDSSHTPDCALGSVPACTCGIREAREILASFKGK